MCLWAILATLEEEWKGSNIQWMLQIAHLPLVRGCWEPRTGKKKSWLSSSRDDPSMEETVRPSFKSSQISTYFPTARSSGKLHAVTSSTLEITSVRMELLIPYSVDKGLASKPDMWSTPVWDSGHSRFFWKGMWCVFLRVTVQLGLGFGTSSLGLDRGSPALQGLGFGSGQGAYTCLRGLTLFLSVAPRIMEFYWHES